MDAREIILTELRDFFRKHSYFPGCEGVSWDDIQFLRTAIIKIQHEDGKIWTAFINRLSGNDALRIATGSLLEDQGYLYHDSWQSKLMMGLFPPGTARLSDDDEEALITCLSPPDTYQRIPDEPPVRQRDGRSEIMYIEYKGGELTGPARIGRVTFSQSRKTLYYGTSKFQSLKGDGYKANFYDAQNGGWYWISKCRADGQDTLYPGIVEIDEEVREQYWKTVRNRPDLIASTSFRSEGKYSKRRPK